MRHPLLCALLAWALAASGSAQAPANDEPAGALPILAGINPGAPGGISGSFYTNVNATNSAGYSATCGTGAGSDVFFSFSALATGVHVFALCPPAGFQPGSLGDGILNVYDAAAPTTSVACDDNACLINSPGNANSLPQVSVALTSGSSYLVRVSVFGATATGDFYVSVVPPTIQGGATCAAAVSIGEGVFGGNFFGAANSGTTITGCATFATSSPNLYYNFVPATSGMLVVHREAGGASKFAATTGACGAETLVAGSCTTTNYAVFAVTAGTTYHLRVGAASAAATALSGAFLCSIRVVPATTANTCATAVTLTNGDNFASSIGATSEPSVAACAGFASSLVLESWGVWTAAAAGQLTVRVSAVNAPQCAVYVGGSCGALGPSTCALNGLGGLSATVTVAAGQQIFVRIGHAAAASVSVFNVRIDFAPAAPNDDCTAPTPVVLGLNGPFSNAGASDGTTVASCATTFRDVWHVWTAPQTGRVGASGCGASADATLAVFASCGGLELACDDDDLANLGPCATAQPTAPYVEFDAVVGASYLIRVASKSATTMTYQLDVAYKFSLVVTPNIPGGTVTVTDLAGPPFALTANVLTFFAGLYPNGWLYGVDIPFTELAAIASAGTPFIVPLDAAGFWTITYPGVPLPLGLTIYGVGVAVNGFGFPVAHTQAFAVPL